MNASPNAVVGAMHAIKAVREVLRNKTGDSHVVELATRLDEIGFDSIDTAEALILLEDETGGEIHEPGQLRTVSDIANLRVLIASG